MAGDGRVYPGAADVSSARCKTVGYDVPGRTLYVTLAAYGGGGCRPAVAQAFVPGPGWPKGGAA